MTLFDPKPEEAKPEPQAEEQAPPDALDMARIFQNLMTYAGNLANLQGCGYTKEQIAAALAAEPYSLIEALQFGVMSYGLVSMLKGKVADLERQLEAARAQAAGGSMLKLARGLEAKGIDMEAVKKAEAENEEFERRRKEGK